MTREELREAIWDELDRQYQAGYVTKDERIDAIMGIVVDGPRTWIDDCYGENVTLGNKVCDE